jgi:hypothetical protein
MDSETRLQLKKCLGGEYHLPDGRVFWMDALAVDEILKRLIPFEFRIKDEVKFR